MGEFTKQTQLECDIEQAYDDLGVLLEKFNIVDRDIKKLEAFQSQATNKAEADRLLAFIDEAIDEFRVLEDEIGLQKLYIEDLEDQLAKEDYQQLIR